MLWLRLSHMLYALVSGDLVFNLRNQLDLLIFPHLSYFSCYEFISYCISFYNFTHCLSYFPAWRRTCISYKMQKAPGQLHLTVGSAYEELRPWLYELRSNRCFFKPSLITFIFFFYRHPMILTFCFIFIVLIAVWT